MSCQSKMVVALAGSGVSETCLTTVKKMALNIAKACNAAFNPNAHRRCFQMLNVITPLNAALSRNAKMKNTNLFGAFGSAG